MNLGDVRLQERAIDFANAIFGDIDDQGVADGTFEKLDNLAGAEKTRPSRY